MRCCVIRRIPAAGNPNGDITIVEYFDFQCPYCRKTHADLQKLLKEDGKVRVVYKDWPILGEVSVQAARLVLAAKFQGKFIAGARCTDELQGAAHRREP